MVLQVFEVSIKLYLLRNIEHKNINKFITSFIDSGLAKDERLLNFHNVNTYKNYTYNSFYPIEKDKIYKKDNIYTIQIRTVDKDLAQYFCGFLKNHWTNDIKALTVDVKIIPKRLIDNLYSITPVIIKNDEFGYWRNNLSISDYERRLKENLIKKYNKIFNFKIDENFSLFTSIEIVNEKPIGFPYKDKIILGDKIKLYISDNKSAQELAYMSLGTGIGEINGRGAGYVNYKWL